MIDIEPHLWAITMEAKRLRRELPSGHPIELHDLVSAGVAHALEFLRFDGVPSPALVRANSRQGMLAEVRRWDHGTRYTRVSANLFDNVDDPRADWKVRRCTPPLPMELMIDLLRELLRLRMAEALPFVSHVLLDEDHQVAARELRMAPCSMKNRIAAARSRLQEALVEYEPKPAKTTHQRAVELFRRGESCAFVAKTIHISEAKAAQIQDEIDPLAKRRRAAQAKAMRTERADVKTADIIQLRREGLTEQAIGKRLGCSQRLVNKRLHKLGIHEGRIDSREKRAPRPMAVGQ